MDDYLKLEFCGVSNRRDMVEKTSWYIQPEGSHTQNNFDWRFNLKPGDEIDAADNFGVWYKSTVLEVQKSEAEEDTKYPEVKIKFGFRQYHENGNKFNEDEPERKFFGWRSMYDTERNVTDPRL